MNILYHHRTRAGGADRIHIMEVTKAFAALGHSVDIISPARVTILEKTHDISQNSINRFLKELRLRMPQFVFEICEIFYNILAYIKIQKMFKTKKYDFIYERYAIFNIAGVLAAKKSKIPILLEVSFTSKSPLYQKRSRIFSPFACWIERKVFQAANGIVVVTKHLKEQLKNLGTNENKIIVLPNAVDPFKFNPDISGIDVRKEYNLTGKKIVGFVGGFSPWHGLDLLLDCAFDVLKKFKKVAFLLIGDGPLWNSLKQKAVEMGIEDSVIFPGRIIHEDLPEYIATFDIGILPGSNDYGSPMKIFEYMAMAKPIVAPKLGPIEEVISNGREGILFKPKDKSEMVIALIALLKNEEFSVKMGARAHKRVLKHQTWKKTIDRILLYLETHYFKKRCNEVRNEELKTI